MGQLQERITSTRKGSVTSVQAIYVPADDLTDPAPASVFAHLNATTVLSRGDRREGHLPGRGPAGLDVDDPQARDRRRGALHGRQRGQERAAALPRAAGHHRDPRHRRALRRGPRARAARPQDRALPVAAVPRRRAVHGHARARTCRSATPCARSARSSTASTTTCPSPRSCSRARSRTSSRRRRRTASGPHALQGRGPHPGRRGLQRRGGDGLHADQRGLHRHPGQPPAAAGDARPDGAAALQVGVRGRPLRAGRGLPADDRRPRARAGRRGLQASTTSTRPTCRTASSAPRTSSPAPRRAPRSGAWPSATSAATRRSSSWPRATPRTSPARHRFTERAAHRAALFMSRRGRREREGQRLGVGAGAQRLGAADRLLEGQRRGSAASGPS